ncbi:MAG: hypothetical protein ACE5GF_07865 [Thermodesulfobacteriota bacterium]
MEMAPELLLEHIAAILFVLWVVLSITGRFYPYADRPVPVRLAVVAAIAAITIAPLDSLSVSEGLFTLNPTFSIGLTAFLALESLKRLTGIKVLSDRNISLFAVWNLAIGSLLYSSTIGLFPFDIYYMGYGFSHIFWMLGALTIVLILAGNTLQWVFIAYAGAWRLGLLQSPNLFDYIIDPFLFFISLGILIGKGIHMSRTRFASSKA